MNPSREPTSPPPATADESHAVQLGLVGDVVVRLGVWMIALAGTLVWSARQNYFSRWIQFELRDAERAFTLARELALCLLVFNLVYLGALMLVRLPLPTLRAVRLPRRGRRWQRDILVAGLLSALTRARYQPPFPAFLVPQLANVQPFRFLLGLQFGPRTHSSFWAEPLVIDPSLVRIGRNVGVGLGTIISGHLITRECIEFAPTVIEDEVQIGGRCVIAGGVHLGRGSVIGLGSYVPPGTVVPPGEFWAGVPAKRVRAATESPRTYP